MEDPGLDGDNRAEDLLLRQGLAALGFATPATFTLKQLERGRCQLGPRSFFHGGVAAASRVLRLLGLPLPPPDDYPACLRDQLHRRLWASSVGELRRAFECGAPGPVFVKPLDRRKRFTGFVAYTAADLAPLGASTRLRCASVVGWRSEYRAYVVHGAVVALCHYAGDPALRVDQSVVQEGVNIMCSKPDSPAGFALDYGVLDDARRTTALVEFNDGFGLGAYPGLSAAQYTRLVLSRWDQLLAPLRPVPVDAA